jgi:hypothetical protein
MRGELTTDNAVLYECPIGVRMDMERIVLVNNTNAIITCNIRLNDTNISPTNLKVPRYGMIQINNTVLIERDQITGSASAEGLTWVLYGRETSLKDGSYIR